MPDRMAAPASIRRMEPRDWPEVRRVYLEGIATRQATFEVDAPGTYEAWSDRRLECCRLVAVSAASPPQLWGWAALSPVSSRAVYSGVAEVGIYVGEARRGLGVGRALLGALVAESERNGIWTLQSSVFPENPATLALHAAFGFREVGRRERIAQHHGRWRDTLLLERRSAVVGVD